MPLEQSKELAVQLASAALVMYCETLKAVLDGEAPDRAMLDSLDSMWGDVSGDVTTDNYAEVVGSLCSIITLMCVEQSVRSAREGVRRSPLDIWQDVAMLWHDRELS